MTDPQNKFAALEATLREHYDAINPLSSGFDEHRSKYCMLALGEKDTILAALSIARRCNSPMLCTMSDENRRKLFEAMTSERESE